MAVALPLLLLNEVAVLVMAVRSVAMLLATWFMTMPPFAPERAGVCTYSLLCSVVWGMVSVGYGIRGVWYTRCCGVWMFAVVLGVVGYDVLGVAGYDVLGVAGKRCGIAHDGGLISLRFLLSCLCSA